MKRHLLKLIVILTLIVSCKPKETKKVKLNEQKPTTELKVENKEDSEKNLITESDTIPKLDKVKKNDLPNIEFNTTKLSANDSLGNFILHLPDTSMLKKHQKEREWKETLTYLYLRNYYTSISKKDSIEYYEWNSKSICSFNQSFEGKIKYSVWECKEAGGISETVEFPKLDLDLTKKFIETVFFDKGNSWTSEENKYEPDGAGCYYEIKQRKEKTIIEIYCGC